MEEICQRAKTLKISEDKKTEGAQKDKNFGGR
jgi:hypothetical protein